MLKKADQVAIGTNAAQGFGKSLSVSGGEIMGQ
jgi:hypothetical protein